MKLALSLINISNLHSQNYGRMIMTMLFKDHAYSLSLTLDTVHNFKLSKATNKNEVKFYK